MKHSRDTHAFGLAASRQLDGERADTDLDLAEQKAHLHQAQEALKLGNLRGREIFEDLLKEPVPLDLVRRIRTSPQGRKAVRLPSPRRQAKLTLPRVAAACLLTFVLGGGLGYVLALKPASAVSPLIADAGDAWLDDVVAHYRTFSRMDGRLAELPASEPAAIIEWLLGNTGVNFRIPDLSDNGLAFEGARMLVAGGMPVGQLVYTSDDGEVISLLFRKNRPDEDGFSELIRDNIALVSWRSATATYVVVGPSSAASLDEIAAKAAGLI